MSYSLAEVKKFNLKRLVSLRNNPEFLNKPISISRIQWHLRIGYNMASHLLEDGINEGILIRNKETRFAASFY